VPAATCPTPRGFETQSCDSLDETLNIIQNWQPDVVFLDLRMPSHDGFEVLEQIQAKFSDIPKVVAVTGSDSNRIRQQVDSAGFDRFLLKPFRVDSNTGKSTFVKWTFPLAIHHAGQELFHNIRRD